MSRAVEVYLNRLQPTSQQTMIFALQALQRLHPRGDEYDSCFTFPWHGIELEEIEEIRHGLESYSSNTANLYLSALRGVLRTAYDIGELDGDEYLRLVDFKLFGTESIVQGIDPEPEDVQRLITHCYGSKNTKGVRDALVIALLFRTPLKRADIARLKIEDVDILVPGVAAAISYKGKQAFIGTEVLRYLEPWLRIRTMGPGWLVTRVDCFPRLPGVSPQTIYDILKFRCEEFSVRHIRPIEFRRLQSLKENH